jgi:hypothetical protein
VDYPLVTTRFTAFALDSSGNASAASSAVRPAAHLIAGLAEDHVGFDAQPGGKEEVVWRDGSAIHVRYATGPTAPTTMTSGTESGQYGGGFGTGAQLPAAMGAKVGVSIFAWADSALTTYRRSSFVVVGGTNSDSFGVTTTPVINPGARPRVTVSVLRHSPVEGVLGLAGLQVWLYRRLLGTSTWTFVTSVHTAADGTANYSVPVPIGSTEYQARYLPLDSSGVMKSSPIARTSVRQLLTSTLSTVRAARNHAVTINGTLTPHRVATVYLQRYNNGRWTNLRSARTSATGAYRIVYTPRSTGRWQLRTSISATGTLLGATSVTRQLTIS